MSIYYVVPSLCLALIIGFFLGTRSEKEPKANEPPKPICMCGHHWGAHKEGHQCNVGLRDGYNVKIGNCACLTYIGPDPLMSGLWSPPPKAKDKP